MNQEEREKRQQEINVEILRKFKSRKRLSKISGVSMFKIQNPLLSDKSTEDDLRRLMSLVQDTPNKEIDNEIGIESKQIFKARINFDYGGAYAFCKAQTTTDEELTRMKTDVSLLVNSAQKMTQNYERLFVLAGLDYIVKIKKQK